MPVLTKTQRNATDTSVMEHQPNKRPNRSARLYVRFEAGRRMHGYLYFPINLPDGAVVVDAKLTLVLQNPVGGQRTFLLQRITSKWAAARVNFNRQPNHVGSPSASTTQGGGAGKNKQDWVFDVTSDVSNWANGTKNFGWRLRGDDATASRFVSAQGGWVGNRPTLVITYHLPPEKPVRLSPRADLHAASETPVLTFGISNGVGNTTQTAFEVEIADNPEMTSAWSSGVVNSGTSQLDLAETDYVPVATPYWRVRIKDTTNMWSEWSDVASFGYSPKPTLTLTNPAGTEITDASPLIEWTLTGTQRYYRLRLKGFNGEPTYDSGLVYSDVTEHPIPPGHILRDDLPYEIHLQAWDDVDRASTVGEPPWVEVTREVTFQYTETIPVVDSFVATALSPRPGVHLTWNRTEAPDEFEIRRNGVVIASDIPDEFEVSAGSYELYDYEAPPFKEHTYRVVSKVFGESSDNNPVQTVTPRTEGVWLIDYENGIEVQILGDDSGSWAMGEVSGVHAPIGSADSRVVTPTIVTQSLRGYEGSLSGVLTEHPYVDKTLDEIVADMWALKRNTGREYVLALSDQSFKVIIGNVVIAPTPHKDIHKQVSFDFWQTDIPTYLIGED